MPRCPGHTRMSYPPMVPSERGFPGGGNTGAGVAAGEAGAGAAGGFKPGGSSGRGGFGQLDRHHQNWMRRLPLPLPFELRECVDGIERVVRHLRRA